MLCYSWTSEKFSVERNLKAVTSALLEQVLNRAQSSSGHAASEACDCRRLFCVVL